MCINIDEINNKYRNTSQRYYKKIQQLKEKTGELISRIIEDAIKKVI